MASGISNPIIIGLLLSVLVLIDCLSLDMNVHASIQMMGVRRPMSGVGVTAVTVLVLATLIDLGLWSVQGR